MDSKRACQRTPHGSGKLLLTLLIIINSVARGRLLMKVTRNMNLMTENYKIEPHAVDETKIGMEHRRELERKHELYCKGRADVIKVRNIGDTSDEVSPCKHEWIGYWQDKTWLRAPTFCANMRCNNEDHSPEIIGAHVRIVGEPNNDRDAWIVPLCKSCNSSDNKSEMELCCGTYMARVVMSRPHKTVE